MVAVFIVGAAVALLLLRDWTGHYNPSEGNDSGSIKVATVDKVVNTPSKYRGLLQVEGMVVDVNESKGMFLLGCKDACVAMPVKYSGKLPETKSEIMVYGELREQEDGRYVFWGKEVRAK